MKQKTHLCIPSDKNGFAILFARHQVDILEKKSFILRAWAAAFLMRQISFFSDSFSLRYISCWDVFQPFPYYFLLGPASLL